MLICTMILLATASPFSADSTDTILVTVSLSQVGGYAVISDVTVPKSVPIRVVANVYADTDVSEVQAILNVPNAFSFLKGYERTVEIGDMVTGESKLVEWYVTPPLVLGEYEYNISFSYQSYKVNGLVQSVVTDGRISYDEWNDTGSRLFTSAGSSMFLDGARIKYDANYLYVYGEVYEFNVENDNSSFLICIDADASGGANPAVGDRMYAVCEDGTLVASDGNGTAWVVSTTEAVCRTVGGGLADTHWTVEMKIPLSEIGTPTADSVQNILFCTQNDGGGEGTSEESGDAVVPNTWGEYTYRSLSGSPMGVFTTDYATVTVADGTTSSGTVIDPSVESHETRLTCYTTLDYGSTTTSIRKGQSVYMEGVPLEAGAEYLDNMVVLCNLHFLKNSTSLYTIPCQGVITDNKIRFKAVIPDDPELDTGRYSLLLEARDEITRDIYTGLTIGEIEIRASESDMPLVSTSFVGEITAMPFSITEGEVFSLSFELENGAGSPQYYYPFQFDVVFLDTNGNIVKESPFTVNMKRGEAVTVERQYVLKYPVNWGNEGEIRVLLQTADGAFELAKSDAIPFFQNVKSGWERFKATLPELPELSIRENPQETVIVVVSMFVLIVGAFMAVITAQQRESALSVLPKKRKNVLRITVRD